MKISDLRTSITALSPAAALDFILAIRNSRLAARQEAAKKKELALSSPRKKKSSPLDVSSLTPEQAAEILQLLTGGSTDETGKDV